MDISALNKDIRIGGEFIQNWREICNPVSTCDKFKTSESVYCMHLSSKAIKEVAKYGTFLHIHESTSGISVDSRDKQRVKLGLNLDLT